MKLEQLRALCALVDEGMNMTRAASVLNTSQPSISKQIKLFELELGTPLLNRGIHRIEGLTPAGAHVVEIARRILGDVQEISGFGRAATQEHRSRLSVVTTHLHASYVFPPIFAELRQRYPDIEIVLSNGEPSEIYDAVVHGKADLGVTTISPQGGDWHVVRIPGLEFGRSLIVPAGHPISEIETPTLEDIARFPLITYCPTFAGSVVIARTFDRQGLQPVVAIRTMDTESIKKYVKLGLGIAVVHSVAIDTDPDPLLKVIDVSHLFGTARTSVIVRPTLRMPEHLWHFIELLAPKWDRQKIVAAIEGKQQQARKAERQSVVTS